MNTLKRILRPCNALWLLLFAGFLLPVSAQSQESESLMATAKGHGMITSAVDERKITSALVVLRQNGTVLITVTADLQLQAEGTWKATASSPEEIVLKITGGALKGEMTGSGKLLLTSDRKSFKELTMNVKLSDGQEVTVTFVADDSEAPVKGCEREAPSRMWLGLEEGPGELCKPCRHDANETVEQFNRANCRYLPTASRVPALEYDPTLYCKP